MVCLTKSNGPKSHLLATNRLAIIWMIHVDHSFAIHIFKYILNSYIKLYLKILLPFYLYTSIMYRSITLLHSSSSSSVYTQIAGPSHHHHFGRGGGGLFSFAHFLFHINLNKFSHTILGGVRCLRLLREE